MKTQAEVTKCAESDVVDLRRQIPVPSFKMQRSTRSCSTRYEQFLHQEVLPVLRGHLEIVLQLLNDGGHCMLLLGLEA